MKILNAAHNYSNTTFQSFVGRSSVSSRVGPTVLNAATVKLAVDLVLSMILLVILAPLMVVIAAAIALDGGPVFFSHKRIGRGGQKFGCLKFRSMRVDAAEILEQRLAGDDDARHEWLTTQKLKNDPRVTLIGRFLRGTSLDELPQIFNVLKLDMSLVGPRPVVEKELLRYGRNVNYYLQVRPGVTGLWQVSGRSNTTYSRRVALDAWYVKNWQFWLDVAILFRTIGAVVRRDGAR
ncbi:MAG: sugar transferase [Janthinobacterium lividum]